MSAREIKLLAVLLNWRTPDMTARAAEALARALDGLDAEMVIVDNDSGDGSEATLRALVEGAEWPVPARVVQSGRNGGFAFGNNAGIRAGRSDGARPDYVYVLNSDAFPAPDAVRVLIDHLERHPQDGFAGSQLWSEDMPIHISAFRFPTIASEFEGTARTGIVTRALHKYRVPFLDLTRTRPVDWLAGASMLMRQDMLDEVGLLDDGFFLYFEETEHFFRARQQGWTATYLVESRVEHLGSVSTGMKQWAEVPKYWFDSRWRYFTLCHGRAYAVAATLARAAGLSVWKLRRLMGAPRLDPPGTLRRLVRHDLRALFRPAVRHDTRAPRPNPSFAE
ncbi:N-acetylglucosaminyl-diphospho-decaprenol L-rhamnosyltransferase [Roseivivax sp. THAF40]|uniref:glycosyltransferase n=1 Tax=unclassified Roseivivax TaxID=2639302 RepID=UPI001267C22F|nr:MULTISPECIES: glycosyltransferase family 2 protein [unclassified Roseivivax]QFS84592.1 N-acetylglucosaminyl-diphospho-decaprenol L-rhamnosyltransferase [Roseivivax sp. THAF197b]QFT48419.1 N-acetylglucosaminyl-diphospho-decaprenol L-rhamnosyltransferase [Roseivivax sp. THAF40]